METSAPDGTVFSTTFQKWRRILHHTNIICTVVIFATECLMYFILHANGLIDEPVPVYLFRFLLLPTLFDGGILLAGWLADRIWAGRERIMNYIPIVQMTLICFVASSVHYIFAVIFGTFCFPIFLTIIFDDRRMTRHVTVLSFVLLTAAQFIGPICNHTADLYLLSEYFVGLIALLAASIICSVLARFQNEKNRTIEAIYRRQLETLERLNLDQKTGLYGSAAFTGYLRDTVSRADDACPPALAVLDIDDFKQVNDTFGHARGDEVIVCLAELMQRMCCGHYVPVRFGGEEFAVIFTDGAPDAYIAFCETLCASFAQSRYAFTENPITISVGIAVWQPGWDSDILFDRADKAMYQSKAAGKNRVTVYQPDRNES